jgi:hypothetical protein
MLKSIYVNNNFSVQFDSNNSYDIQHDVIENSYLLDKYFL